MKNWVMTIICTFGLLFISSEAKAAMQYKDVQPTHNFYSAVESLIEQKAISSHLDYFRPNEYVTRGQAAKIIAIAAGLDYENATDLDNFKDVPKSHQFYKYIRIMHNKGIITGYNFYEFGVNDYLTRGQMAKILVQSFNVPLLSIHTFNNPEKFTDLLKEYDGGFGYKQFGREVMTLNYFNLVAGISESEYGLSKPVTRSQLALMIEKLQKHKDSYTNLRKFYMYEQFTNPDDIHKLVIEDESIARIVAYTSDYGTIISYENPIKPAIVFIKPVKVGTTVITADNGESIRVTIFERDGVLRASYEKL
ncbi:S-layer homology domain-containing protein [Solibacillus sp. CAU 1738]|uniref:S-layer homology domain-containing protein n=1 Tax=Solibacillus sp. CAU 1738 TaxID=3140363 RepID=UPI003261C7F8